ncbi:LOW QUALITY PROTEIN: U3 small nucleolar RNA-associated protein 25 homolog [Lagenorhynchus albirostris]|uniref:LOW QUALITY PROTEIN: U3 small nucleolar RNA-associated protein 25 homolog n=1 Tax=Lagenorhynchus albirostris TaxID=27610 RepID=UPI0028E30714|nr:LOW QUALITY PROTEIN: U3 small nucleolar RNA-associated protein 25 homolog [Lagenorhynchus albirostris]
MTPSPTPPSSKPGKRYTEESFKAAEVKTAAKRLPVRVSRKEAKPQTCQLSESLDTSSSESEAESEPEQVSGYNRLLATLKDVSKEDEEEEEEEEDSVIDETEMNLEDGDSDISVEEETAVASTDMQKNAALPADPKGKDGLGPPGTSEESPEEFTDAKHESLFSLETNFLEEEREGNCSLKALQDPFAQHVNKELKEKEIQAVATNPKTTHQLKWPILGQLVFSSRFQQLKPETFKPPKDIDLKSLHLQKPLESTWIKTNSQFLSGPPNSSSPFPPLQKELFLIMNSYRDLFYPERTALKNGEEIRHVYCLHVINHVLKANAQVLTNNSRCRSQKLGVGDDDDFRDQGLTRPKVLIVVPFREAALRVVQLFISLLEGDSKKKIIVGNKKRFNGEYGSDPEERPPNLKRPEDYEAVFVGNIDDHFRTGVAILQRSIRLYAPFYSSDILIASPLGLRTIIGGEGEKKRDFDFLSSIELLIIDQADIYLMQNWEHVLHLMNHMDLLPLDSHGVDFSRVRMWSLNNWSKYYRQTLLSGAPQDAQINSVFIKYCIHGQGQVAVRNVPMTGCISHVLVQLPRVFQRMEAENLASVIDARFNFFVNKILPQYRDAVMSHTLIYVPSYLDFVRLRNYFKKEELNFTHICECAQKSGVSRARHFFLQGEKQFLLLTERFHFYKRYTIKGIRNLIFYELPTYPHFYSEVCNMLQATTRGEEAAWTCTVLYSKYDAQRLAAVVGVERAAQMLQSKKNAHLFITGER